MSLSRLESSGERSGSKIHNSFLESRAIIEDIFNCLSGVGVNAHVMSLKAKAVFNAKNTSWRIYRIFRAFRVICLIREIRI